MKANYKVVNNRQAQLKKVIQNFEPTGVCAFLMFRYYVMQLMAESEAAGGLNVPLSDSAVSTHSSIFRMSPVSAVGTSSWLSQNLCPNTNRQKERSTAFVTTNMRSDEL